MGPRPGAALLMVVCAVSPHAAGTDSTRSLTCAPALLRIRGGKASALGQRLQNLGFMMRKDPEGYVPEIENTFKKWGQHRGLWESTPYGVHKEFGELSVFLAQNQVMFPLVLHEYPGLLTELVRGNHTSMHADLRMKMCEAIAIATARKSIPVTDMCSIFFKMFHIPEKKLRHYLYASSVNAIKRLNANSVDQVANRALQRTLAAFLHGPDARSGKVAITMMVELYKRRMWDDTHAVNTIGAACFSRLVTVRNAAIKFFLGVDLEPDGEDEEESDDFGIKTTEARMCQLPKF